MSSENQPEIPLQPVEKPIICAPYDEPAEHWQYNRETGAAFRAVRRAPTVMRSSFVT
jgi:type III restriction enzyme